jgi:hypothetical protein
MAIKEKTYQEKILSLRIPLKLDDEDLDSFKMDRLSCLYLIGEVL